MDKFEFLEKFKEQTKDEISKLHYKKYLYQWSDLDKLKVTYELKEIEKYFKSELELDIYPVYGTLLGIVRYNDYIGWDTDIDMAYLSKCHTNKAVLNEFNMIVKFLEEKGILLNRIKTASHLHIYSPSHYLRVDLWISWIDDNGKYHIVWTVNGDIDSSMILPFKTVEFYGQTLTQMNNPELFIDEHYYPHFISGGEAKDWAKRKPRFELEPWHGK